MKRIQDNINPGPSAGGQETSIVSSTIDTMNLSGSYRGRIRKTELLLRVDVDGVNSKNIISGDFFEVQDGRRTLRYIVSFTVTKLDIEESSQEVTYSGTAVFSAKRPASDVRVTLRGDGDLEPTVTAFVHFKHYELGIPMNILCHFESRFFRTVQYEVDYVEGNKPFTSYDTGFLTPEGNPRVLTVPKVFAEAGVLLVNTGESNKVPLEGAGDDCKWSKAELHNAMEKQFSLWDKKEPWKVWLLAAGEYQDEEGTVGVMLINRENSDRAVLFFTRK